MKILLSAYSCEPGQGSERGVGWNIAKEVARHHQVWVLTRPDESKEAIEAELKSNPDNNLNFVYFTIPFWQDSLRWGQSGAMQIHYYLWQIQAYFVARRLHEEIGFEVAHHVTFVKYSSPSFLSLLPIPFVWGPVGGGESAPKPFWQDFSPKAKAYELARSVARKLGELDPFVRYTARESSAILATTEDTASRLEKIGADGVDVLSQVGLSTSEISALSQYELPQEETVKFISIGRLLHWKGFHLGLRAFAEAGLPDAEYWIVGEGSELGRLQQLAIDLKIERQVKFCGWLSREAILSTLKNCHVLVHPSLHDSGGMVCIEAMAAGRPVICLDLGGPAIQVTEQTGFKIKAVTPQQTVKDIAAAMNQLANNQDSLKELGEAAKERASQCFSWHNIGYETDCIYSKVVQ